MRALKAVFFGLSVTLLASHVPAHAQKALVLEPSAPWAIDYAEERCSLIRSFGADKQRLTLRIDAYASTNSFRFLLVGNPVPASVAMLSKVRVGFSADAAKRDEVEVLLGLAGDQRAASFSAEFEPIDRPFSDPAALDMVPSPRELQDYIRSVADFEAEVKSITVDLPKSSPIELKTGSMAKPLQSLRTCIDDLVASWGVDVAEYHKHKSAPELVDGNAGVRIDYPEFMEDTRLSTFLPVRIMVDENGKPGECVLQVSMGDERFKRSICNAFTRGFKPAIDEQGKPVASFYRTMVLFKNTN